MPHQRNGECSRNIKRIMCVSVRISFGRRNFIRCDILHLITGSYVRVNEHICGKGVAGIHSALAE